METSARHLVFHATVILLIGLVYWGNMVGAGTSLLAATLLVVAGFLSL